MAQLSHYDNHVLTIFAQNKFIVNTEEGIVLRTRNSLPPIQVGSKFPSSKEFTLGLNIDGMCFNYPLSRFIWLFFHKQIPENHIVYHLDGDISNNKISNLALKLVPPKTNKLSFSPQEIQLLKDNYLTKTLPELEVLLPGRSIHAMRQKLTALLLPSKRGAWKQWSLEEDELLIKLHKENKSVKEISKVLNRSINSVRLRAVKFLNLFREDRLIKPIPKELTYAFYTNLKGALVRGTAKAKCCLCNYEKHIHLHHIDGNNKNHCINNIASLCPNCHTEVERDEHKDTKLYCRWWRLLSDNSKIHEDNNYELIHGISLNKENK